MRQCGSVGMLGLILAACSGSELGSVAPGEPGSNAAETCPDLETLPLTAGGEASAAPGGEPEPSPYVSFTDCETGFRTQAVYDADREIVRFDPSREAMVSAASDDSVGGWSVAGVNLRWSRSGVRFEVRFGTEAGERRAYFTEAGPGTICNLNLAGPEVLYISATRETPPNP